jgi:alkanesulfonate monooxygenase SsuD/methylene tetrahydromethanopterin reductase-like flavin-dependent oxidoreductase (luciferase family)
MLLMATAMRTTTLRLGSAVIVLPWHNKVADTWFQPVK